MSTFNGHLHWAQDQSTCSKLPVLGGISNACQLCNTSISMQTTAVAEPTGGMTVSTACRTRQQLVTLTCNPGVAVAKPVGQG